MAPRAPDPGPTKTTAKTTNDGVKKSKKKDDKVRKIDNGLLDVENTGGKDRQLIAADGTPPLLRLPGEIRNKIWSLVLGGNTLNMFAVKSARTYGMLDAHVKVIKEQRNQFGLAQVCRQVRTETAILPYQLNTFRFDHEDSWVFFDQILPVQAAAIRNIRLVSSNGRYFAQDSRGMFDFTEPLLKWWGGVRQDAVDLQALASITVEVLYFKADNSLDSDKQYLTDTLIKRFPNVPDNVQVNFELASLRANFIEPVSMFTGPMTHISRRAYM